MHQRTILTLAELAAVDWFTRVGTQDATQTVYVNTWQEAVQSCNSEAWESLCLEAANQYTSRLFERNPERFNKWNVIVQEVKKETIPLVVSKTKDVMQANNLPKGFIDTVQWDILHLCMEAEYADVFPPSFFAGLSYWYVKGHFPCGWEGDFPEGRLVIF